MRDFSRHVLLCLHLKKATHLFCLPASSQRIPDDFLSLPSFFSSLVRRSVSLSLSSVSLLLCVRNAYGSNKRRIEQRRTTRREESRLLTLMHTHTCIVGWTVYTLLFFSFKYMSSVFIDRTYSPHSLVVVVFFFSLAMSALFISSKPNRTQRKTTSSPR